jgi:hypothetical protein
MTESQIGTDELISLVDGWGPDDPHVPLHLDEWKESNFDPPIGLLLGGVGDGKHFLWFLLRARISGCRCAAATLSIFATPSPLFLFARNLCLLVCILLHVANA